VHNAIVFSRNDESVLLSSHEDEKFTYLVVEDAGIGIGEADLPHVFEQFYRGDGAHEIEGDGHGLGLFVTKTIVEAHGGRVDIESRKGFGTKVTLCLPRKAASKSREIV